MNGLTRWGMVAEKVELGTQVDLWKDVKVWAIRHDMSGQEAVILAVERLVKERRA